MTDFEWLDSGPNCSEGHYSMHSKNPHLSPSLYTTGGVVSLIENKNNRLI